MYLSTEQRKLSTHCNSVQYGDRINCKKGETGVSTHNDVGSDISRRDVDTPARRAVQTYPV